MRIKFGFSDDMTRAEAFAWIKEWEAIANESPNEWDQFAALRVLDELVMEFNHRWSSGNNADAR